MMTKRQGQSMIEYVFLISLIALVVIFALIIFGEQLRTMYNNIVNQVNI